jgi:hypothetical protein
MHNTASGFLQLRVKIRDANPSATVFLEKQPPNTWRNFLSVMEPERSLQYSQQPNSDPCPEPNQTYIFNFQFIMNFNIILPSTPRFIY